MFGESPDIHTETVSYTANGTTLKGYLAYNKALAPNGRRSLLCTNGEDSTDTVRSTR